MVERSSICACFFCDYGPERGDIVVFADLADSVADSFGAYALAPQFDFYFTPASVLIAEFLPCKSQGIAPVIDQSLCLQSGEHVCDITGGKPFGSQFGGYFRTTIFGLIAKCCSVVVGLFGCHGRVAMA